MAGHGKNPIKDKLIKYLLQSPQTADFIFCKKVCAHFNNSLNKFSYS